MKKVLIIVVVALVLAGAGVGGYFLLKPACPASCDDNNSCTQDTCSPETGYACKSTSLEGPQTGCSATTACSNQVCRAGTCKEEYAENCCGNKSCELNETYQTCPKDCPNCDDENKCTKDSYDYHAQKCLNKPILDEVCCGNKSCETGETYETCAPDCINCDDENKCTKDSFDYHEQKCLNEIIKPCCGNKICDKGAEANSSCSADCPNCNDGNQLTSDSFNYETQKCANVTTHYLIDDFESGSQNWGFYNGKDGQPNLTAWTLVKEGTNMVLKGTGHNFADLSQSGDWDNYMLKLRFKKIGGFLQINFRSNFFMPTEELGHRYIIRFEDSNQISLAKGLNEQAGQYQEFGRGSVAFGGGWNTMELRVYGGIINIYINNSLAIKYKDTQNPFLSGKINFETGDDTAYLFDNVEVKLISAKDVISP